jgi:ATP-binding cassette subfamily C protein LapB
MKTPTEHGKDQSFMARGKLRGSIKFKGVEFAYPGQEGKALQGVDFSIRAGERVGIVGRVGSGKTTIAKLIVKLFDAQEGVVYLDGIDISQIDPSEVRENVGYVAQDPWLIAGTIEQNITLGAANVSRDDMILAAQLSGVADFVDQHPKGYKLVVKERGEGLSGGQRQAITVARALVRRPSILLFDEPTSGMDARSERIFIENFKKQALESTLVLITHRTSLLPLVDRVIIVDNGAVVGSASVEDFLRSKPSTGNTEGEDPARAMSTGRLEAQIR